MEMRGELERAVTDEQALALRDVLIARTGAAYRHRPTDGQVRRAAQAISAHPGWDEDEVQPRKSLFADVLRTTYGPD